MFWTTSCWKQKMSNLSSKSNLPSPKSNKFQAESLEFKGPFHHKKISVVLLDSPRQILRVCRKIRHLKICRSFWRDPEFWDTPVTSAWSFWSYIYKPWFSDIVGKKSRRHLISGWEKSRLVSKIDKSKSYHYEKHRNSFKCNWLLNHILPKTNMEPENTPLEKEKHLATTNLWVPSYFSGV